MDPLLGEIRLLPFTFAPVGWTPCQGQTLPISSNQPLFSLLGTNFGGDGQTTFGLPDLQKSSPLGAVPGVVGYCICVDGTYPRRD